MQEESNWDQNSRVRTAHIFGYGALENGAWNIASCGFAPRRAVGELGRSDE
jgi:hypothetical protein